MILIASIRIPCLGWQSPQPPAFLWPRWHEVGGSLVSCLVNSHMQRTLWRSRGVDLMAVDEWLGWVGVKMKDPYQKHPKTSKNQGFSMSFSNFRGVCWVHKPFWTHNINFWKLRQDLLLCLGSTLRNLSFSSNHWRYVSTVMTQATAAWNTIGYTNSGCWLVILVCGISGFPDVFEADHRVSKPVWVVFGFYPVTKYNQHKQQQWSLKKVLLIWPSKTGKMWS